MKIGAKFLKGIFNFIPKQMLFEAIGVEKYVDALIADLQRKINKFELSEARDNLTNLLPYIKDAIMILGDENPNDLAQLEAIGKNALFTMYRDVSADLDSKVREYLNMSETQPIGKAELTQFKNEMIRKIQVGERSLLALGVRRK